MRAVFSSLVATSLLIHAAIGCCWHHAHDGSCDDHATIEQAADVDCGHSHGDQDEHGEPSHGPCKDHCQGTCHYLPVQKAQVESLSLHLQLDLAAIVPATCDVRVAALLHADRVHESAAELPVRLHLYHQILLI